ncbi:MAG: ferric reductase-like transmembrane domain-containing protein [Acetobacteraceae bacterium]|nr:ferric reductase-like transmembrane domain-containing protein [Acetobacteraceae bacterium]
MRHLKIAFWGWLALLTGLWLIADLPVLRPRDPFVARGSMVQLTGVLAIGCMSLAMILALRPRWPEQWLGGLDRMYRLHKWLGISALVVAITHWLWSQGPKWGVRLGWLAPPSRGAQPVIDNAVQQALLAQRNTAESVGEWAFYAAVLLIAVALIHRIPYRLFYKTHRLIAVAYLALVFHAVVLIQFRYWTTPLGVLVAAMLAGGTAGSVLALIRRIGAGRQVRGEIASLCYYHPSVPVLEGEIDVPNGWPGHKAGQFAFVTSNASEGHHPYTIASAWNPARHRLTFITKELGDWTRSLRERLRVGQRVTVEGPYGCFTFEDTCPCQIWIGAGIGVTPFIARMKHLAMEQRTDPSRFRRQDIHFFYTTAEWSDEAIAKLRADAAASKLRLHILYSPRDGRLTGDRIRAAVPAWREASIWFCGPLGFGSALRQDFADHGLEVGTRFHQELFAMR